MSTAGMQAGVRSWRSWRRSITKWNVSKDEDCKILHRREMTISSYLCLRSFLSLEEDIGGACTNSISVLRGLL